MPTNTAPDIEFEAIAIRSTPKAILITTQKDLLEHHWLPLSLISVIYKDKEVTSVPKGESCLVQCPFWLAQQREILF